MKEDGMRKMVVSKAKIQQGGANKMKSTLAGLFLAVWRFCSFHWAVLSARRYLACGRQLRTSLITDPSQVSGYYLPKGLRADDCWFFHVDDQSVSVDSLRVGASRVLCLRRKDGAVVSDRYCGE